MASRILTYAAMVFVPVVNSRALTVEHYGYYKQFHLVFETLAPLLILGFPLSLQYYLPRARRQRDKSVYVTQTLCYLAVAALAAWGIYLVMGMTLGEGIGAMVRAFYWRLCAFTGLTIMSYYMEWLFAAEREIGRQALYHSIFAIIQAVTVMVTSWIYRDVSALIWAITIFALVRCLFALGYTFKRYRPSLRLISVGTIREQLTFALPMGLFAITLLLVNQTDKFIITRFMGRKAFAIYAIGAFQLPVVNMIAQSVRAVIFPLMVQKHESGEFEEIAHIWKRAVFKMTVMYYPIFVFFEAIAHGLIPVMFTETYRDATPIFMIYLALLPRVAMDSVAVIQVYKDTGYLLRTFAAAFFMNLVLSILLFEWIGREGVPLATLITMYSVSIKNMYYSSRLCRVGFFEMVPVRAILVRFVAAVVPGLPLWWVTHNYPVENLLTLAGLAVAYFSVYLAICRSTGLLTWDDIASLIGKRRR